MKNKTEENRRNLEMIALTWTISGVALAACGTFEDFLGLDDSGGGGNALHVQRSPVQGARIYFDMNNDGDIEADDITAQDEAFPQGFVTDATGRARNIPTIFQGLPFKAVLDGAIDADTGTPLSGEMLSIPGADGAHRLASPITDLIATDGGDPKEVVADLLGNPDADSEEVAQVLEAINNPRSYLGGDANIEALAVYLAETNSPAQDKASEFLVGDDDPDPQNRETLFIANADDVPSTTADIDLEGVAISTDAPAGTYIATIHAVSHGGSSDVGYSIVESDGTTPDPDSVFSVDSQGVISVAGALSAGMVALYVQVTDGDSAQTVKIDVTVADAPRLDELPAGDETATIMENTPSTDALISGITPDDTSITAADFVIREAVPAGLGFLVDRLEIVDGTGNTFNLALKSGQSLDHDAIPGGVLNVHVWAETSSGVRSNALALRIQVEQDPDEVAFSGSFTGIVAEDGNLVAQGTFSVENQGSATATPADGTYGTLTLADGRWTYTLNNENSEVDGLLTGEVLLDTATITLSSGESQNILIRINGANEDVRFVDADENRITRDVAENGIEIGADATNGVSLGDVVPEIMGLLASNDDSNVVLADDMGGLFSLDSATGVLTFTGTAADIAGLGGSANLVLVLTAPASIGDEEVRFNLRVNVINEDDDGRAEYEITGDVEANRELVVSRVQGSDDPDGVVGAVSFQWFRGDEGTPTFTLLGTGDTYRVTQTDIDSSDSIGVFVIYTDGSGVTYTHTDGDDTTTIAVFASPVTFTSPDIADRAINLDENIASGSTPRFNVQATSEDDAGNTIGIASYELLDENRDVVSEYKGFEIDANGVIALTGSLDYEMDEVITLRVLATDENSPAETATLTLTVNVGDVNEHAPVFVTNADDPTLTDGTEEISESAGRGTVVARVRAVDADGSAENNTVGYDITNGDANDVFRIDGNGVITVNAPLDYDTTPSYTLTITASDGESGSIDATQMVTINLTDVNDIVPDVTPPMDATGRVRTTGSDDASGNAAASTGYSITITDADTNNDFTFGVSDPRFDFVRQQNSNVWDLVLLAGQTVTEDVGTTASPNTITLTYYVDDGANRVPGGTVTLTVIDTPVGFTNDRTETVTENNRAGADVIQVQASSTHEDGTDSPITSYMFLDENDMPTTKHQGFTIDSTSGQITVDDRLDYEADGATLEFTLRVIATDTPDPNVQGDEAETGTQNITISLGDANDNAPIFTVGQDVAATIPETQTAADGTILRITADDADGSAANSNVIYSIESGDPDGLFFIDPSSGALRVANGATLNYDTDPATTSYTLMIGVSDGRDASGTADTAIDAMLAVTITLSDVNDIVPDVDAPAGRIRTTEAGGNAAETNTGYSIEVIDSDVTVVIPTVTSADPRFRFDRDGTSDTWNLILLANQQVDLGTFSLGYSVTDGVNPVTGTISLEAVDTPVTFTSNSQVPFAENNNAGANVIQVVATSTNADNTPSAIASYMFLLDDGVSLDTQHQGFTIDSTTGQITVDSVLDYEAAIAARQTQFTLRVVATDTPEDADDMAETRTQTITIHLLNEDEPGEATFGIRRIGNFLTLDSAQFVDDPDSVVGIINHQWFSDASGTETEIDLSHLPVLNRATFTIPSGDADSVIYRVDVTYIDGIGETKTVTARTSLIKFSQAPIDVAEDQGTATFATLSAMVDGASGDSTITFGFQPNAPQSITDVFALTDGGALSVSGNLDYESGTTRYTIPIRITYDPDGPASSAGEIETRDVDVVINIGDANEHAPELLSSLQVATGPGVMGGLPALAGATANADTDLDGTAAAEYIDGEGGNDEIDGGGGNDHILGGAGTDGITLSSAEGSVETVYYRFSSAGTAAWVGSDGVDTITNFRFGEDRLVFVDTDGMPVSMTDFLSASNLNTAGGQLKIKPIVDTSGTTSTLNTKYGDFLDGVEIIFGSNKIRIEYETSTRPRTYDPADGDYTSKADALFGPILNDMPSKLDSATGYLIDNTLLSAYFGDGTHDNLQVTGDDVAALIPSALISERYTSGDGVFARVSARDADGTPNNQVARYDITGGTGMSLFDIDSDGWISVKAGATLDYNTATSHTLTITATDGGTPAMTSAEQTITIGILRDVESVYRLSKTNDILTVDLVTPDSDGVVAGSVMYQWFTTDGTSGNQLGGLTTSNTLDTSISSNALPSSDSVYGVTVTYDDNANNQDQDVVLLLTSVIEGTLGDDAALAGTSGADYIVGGSGDDIITSGGGNDHILGGPGGDTITLSTTTGTVETIYYLFFSTDSDPWLGIDGADTINNFRRGEDRLIFIDVASLIDEGSGIDLETFLSDDNVFNTGGELAINPINPEMTIDGVEIIFGNQDSQKLTINYHTATREQFHDGTSYTTAGEGYLGTGGTGFDTQTDRLSDNTLLRHYFGDGTHDNLQVTDGEANVIWILNPDITVYPDMI